jgi:ParB/RepB/Spo0J family partition protein
MADQTLSSLTQMPIEELQGNPLQPRGVISPESLVDLVDSIKEHGVLEPLVVAKTPAGYQIIAGERRWRASKIAGLTHVPVIIKETTPRGMLEMAIVENVQRIDLNPIERAKAFQRLIEEFSLPTSEIAKRVGKSQAYVSNSLRILTLPDALKDGLLTGLISEGHARALAAIEDPKVMIEAYKIILRESGSVRRAEDLARRMKIAAGEEIHAGLPSTHVNKQKMPIVDANFDRMEAEMRRVIGGSEKNKVKLNRSQRETRIMIVLKGNVQDTEEILQSIYKKICF